MKKILIVLTIILSCLGINKVSADTYQVSYTDTYEYSCNFYVSDYEYLKEIGYSDELENIYELLFNKYNESYSADYSYYYFGFNVSDSKNCNSINAFETVGNIIGYMFLYKNIPDFQGGKFGLESEVILYSTYSVSNNSYDSISIGSDYMGQTILNSIFFNPLTYFISNFDLVNNSGNTYIVSGNSYFTVNPGDVIPPYYTVDNAFQINYTEINLNDYAYVALALKDYSKYNYSTTIEVKGQYCPTSVYGMGLKTSEDLFKKQVSDVCTPYYKDYTPVRINFYESIVKSFPVYYVKAYDTTRDNYIKVDTSIFDITYISEEEKDNPYVLVQGNIYPTIPFDKLPSNAIQNTQNGYIPGQVEDFSFTDIFTSPLDFLIEIWSSIATFFKLITSFILLLPVPMQGFLYASFTLAIVLGLIKIIIGAF